MSGTASGPIVLDHVYYASSFQFQRRTSALPSLISADPAALVALRISPDSVQRLLLALAPTGIPVQTAGMLGQMRTLKETDLAWLFRTPLTLLP